MNPLSLEISSFRPVSVTLLRFLRPVSFREVLAFRERVFVGLLGGPVPLCSCLAIFVPLVITSRLSPAEAVAAAPRGAFIPNLPAGGVGGRCYLDGRAKLMYPAGSLTQLPLSTDCLCFFISADADSQSDTGCDLSVRGCWASGVLTGSDARGSAALPSSLGISGCLTT